MNILERMINYLRKSKIVRKKKEIQNEEDYNVYFSNINNKSDDITNDKNNIDNISF